MATLTKAANSNAVLSGTWTGQTNAYATTGDNVYCTHTQSSRNGVAEIRFGFPSYATGDIPDGSTINSVKVSAEVKVSQTIGSVVDLTIENPSGTDVGPIGETSATTDTLIESTATTVPTLTALRNQTVFAHILYDRANSNTSETISIDYVSITVDYTPGATTVPGSFTADAILEESSAGTRTGSLTANAAILRTTASSFSADAILLAPVSSSFTVAAAIKATITPTFATNAVLRTTVATYAVVEVPLTGSYAEYAFGMVVVAQRAQSITLPAGRLVQVAYRIGRTSDAPADSVVVEIQTDNGGEPSGTVVLTVETIVGSSLPTATLSVYPERVRDVSGLLEGVYWLVFRRTGALTTEFEPHYSVNGAISNPYPSGVMSYYDDSWTAQAALDAVFRAVVEIGPHVDAVLAKGQAGSFLVNAAILETTTSSFSADALLVKPVTGSFTVAATITGTQAGSFSVDAVITRSYMFGQGGVIAQDSFTEAVDTELTSHTAEIGGTWTRLSGTAGATVNAANDILVRGGSGTTAFFSLGPSLGDGDIYHTMRYSLGGVESHVFARYIDASNWYRLSYYWDIGLYVRKNSAGLLTMVQDAYPDIPSPTDVRIRWLITGSNPTRHRVRAWDTASAEPSTWDIDATDNTASNQISQGPVGVPNPVALDGMQDDFLVVAEGASGPTIDAVIIAGAATVSGSFTVAAAIHKIQAGNFSADANLRGTATGSTQADAIRKRTFWFGRVEDGF